MKKQTPSKRVVLTRDNLGDWPYFQELYEEGKIVFDKAGRLRYPHGAPVGDLILVRVNKDGREKYRESAEERFDPGSPAAAKFGWPE